MDPLTVAVIAAIGIAAWTAAKPAASPGSPPGGGGGGGGGGRNPADFKERVDRFKARHGASVRAVVGPMPDSALYVIGTRESNGDPDAFPIPGQPTFWEWGLFQAVIERSGGGGEAKLANADPRDPLSAVWIVQKEFARLLDKYIDDLPELGYQAPELSDVSSWVCLLHLARSIGFGGVKSLLRKVPANEVGQDPTRALAKVAADPGKVGVQNPEKVAMRIRRAIALYDDADRYGGSPVGPIRSLGSRPDGVKPFPGGIVEAAAAKELEGKRRLGR